MNYVLNERARRKIDWLDGESLHGLDRFIQQVSRFKSLDEILSASSAHRVNIPGRVRYLSRISVEHRIVFEPRERDLLEILDVVSHGDLQTYG